MKLNENENISFRDTISTTGLDGKRVWVHAKKPKGKLYNYRRIVGYFLLLFLVAAPFIKINGEPFMMFNVIERKFSLFGVIFWTHDFYIFYLMLVSLLVFVALFTVVYGRIFCGWICPQTIFLEMIFRPIEWLIEGNPNKQRLLNKQSYNLEKIFKKVTKHVLYFFVSFAIANVFLSYIIGAEALYKITSEPISSHLSGFISILVFSVAFYFIFSSFREQVCSLMCPYGRLQSVLINRNTIAVTYDYLRGEPRGVKKKGSEEKSGDCIDCNNCIEVCPTAIDIKNGTQLECINCTACIDACNSVMKKMSKPPGLIRYASENGIKSGKSFKFTPINIAYTTVLFGILMFFITMMVNRTDTETTILRAKGLLYQEQANDEISNLYTIEIVNKTRNNIPITVKLISPKGRIQIFGSDLVLLKTQEVNASCLVYINKKEIKSNSIEIEFGVYEGGKLLETVKTNFKAP